MALRSHTVLLVALVEDITAGRLPAEVTLDGSRYTIPVFLAEFASSDLDAMRHALGLPATTTAADIAAVYDKRRRAPQVDKSKPYLDMAAVETRTGAVLLSRIATALRHGGPIAGRVQVVDNRGARTMALSEALHEMECDRLDRAEQAASTLGIDAVRVGDVARVIVGRLEAAGILPKVAKSRGPDRVMEHARIRSGALAR